MLYGNGYVLLAFLPADLVDRLHWLKQSQLLLYSSIKSAWLILAAELIDLAASRW